MMGMELIRYLKAEVEAVLKDISFSIRYFLHVNARLGDVILRNDAIKTGRTANRVQ